MSTAVTTSVPHSEASPVAPQLALAGVSAARLH